jgi:hypothetical protein
MWPTEDEEEAEEDEIDENTLFPFLQWQKKLILTDSITIVHFL